MPETHLYMMIASFLSAMWWTKSWLMDPIIARWRFGVSAFSGSLLWIVVAYTSTRAVESSAGVQIIYASDALSWFSVFMALVSVAGLILGLYLWVEEEAKETAEQLPDAVSTSWNQ